MSHSYDEEKEKSTNDSANQSGTRSLVDIVLVENLNDWKPIYPNLQVVSAKDYLAKETYFKLKNARIINLCRNYKYLSKGYYCSLLAEARRHKIIPSVRTLNDLSKKEIYSLDVENLNELLQKALVDNNTKETGSLEVYILFGLSDYQPLQELAREVFETFKSPLLKVEFKYREKWQIASIKPILFHQIPSTLENLFIEGLTAFTRKRWISPKTKSLPRYYMAILHDPKEKFPPSDKDALKNFVKAGKSLNVEVELIQKKDYSKLGEYDALFIRETTAIEHHTYRFAKKAETEGLAVIDDPNSILLCTNKVFLAELLKTNKIPTPKTIILQKDSLDTIESELHYPIVLKIPDGSFSRGVYKANARQEMKDIASKLLKESEIILGQEYLYTEFDWRIGILNRTPIFASQYYMSKKHWQIYDHNAPGGVRSGKYKTVLIEYAPPDIVRAATNAANLIGDGLYGVDIKQTSKGPCVIEINDNPNIDEGVEDSALKDELYKMMIRDFIRRIEKLSTIT
ncbi:MAG: RimK family protein [Leptospiraceae bacterium]|nr:RimK family protein [Leptospiraceae bacterium]MCP5495608.1 RimK family protein [Leptospiraceae bacterium]